MVYFNYYNKRLLFRIIKVFDKSDYLSNRFVDIYFVRFIYLK